METLINKFPRQVAFPQRVICQTEKQFYTMINLLNGKKAKLYFSIYNCDLMGNFDNASIDKIFFDMDKPEVEPIIRAHKNCKYKHLML